MEIIARLDGLARRLCFIEPPVPADTFIYEAGCLAERIQSTGDPTCWNGYRLIDVDGARPRGVGGQWPLVTKVTYLEDGEDGEPTVYITSEDNPHGTFCVGLHRPVSLAPTDAAQHVVL